MKNASQIGQFNNFGICSTRNNGQVDDIATNLTILDNFHKITNVLYSQIFSGSILR